MGNRKISKSDVCSIACIPTRAASLNLFDPQGVWSPSDIEKDLRAKIDDLNESIAEAEKHDVIVDLHIQRDSLKGIDSNPVIAARILQRI